MEAQDNAPRSADEVLRDIRDIIALHDVGAIGCELAADALRGIEHTLRINRLALQEASEVQP